MITIKEVVEAWGITIRRMQVLYENGQVPAAFKIGDILVMSKDTPKPLDGRTKSANKAMIKDKILKILTTHELISHYTVLVDDIKDRNSLHN